MKGYVFTVRRKDGGRAESLRHFCANMAEVQRLACDLAAGKGVASVEVAMMATGRTLGSAKPGRGGAAWSAAG